MHSRILVKGAKFIRINYRNTSQLFKLRQRQLEKKFSVIEITHDGIIQKCSRSSKELVIDGNRTQGILPRDLFALDIGPDVDSQLSTPSISRRLSPPVILPRSDVIVISIGNIKAVIGREKITVFEPKLPLVKQWTYNFLKTVQSDPSAESGLPFEMIALENILKSTCETFERRLLLFGPLVDNLLIKLENEDLFDGMDKLLPISDTLHQFEMEVKETLDCLSSLLANDDDMALLLLSERTAEGQVDVARHVTVELLVESYAARLKHTINKLIYQEQKVKNRYEVAEFTMQMQRNRILRMNLYTGMAGVSIGLGTAIFGAFGMNVPLPEVPLVFGGQFDTVVAVSMIISLVIYSSAFSYSWGVGLKQVRLRRAEQLTALHSVFSDINAVDYAVRESVSAMSSDKDDALSEGPMVASSSTSAAILSPSSAHQNQDSTVLHSANAVETKDSTINNNEHIVVENSQELSKIKAEKQPQAIQGSFNVQSKKDIWRQGHRVTKEDFARYMRVASGGKEINDKSVDLFFGILDADKDGYLAMSEASLMDEDKNEAGENASNMGSASSHPTFEKENAASQKIDKLSNSLRKPF